MKKPLFLLFFIFLFFFIFPKVVQAEVLLWDDFNDGNANDGVPVDWEEFAGPSGSWWIETGEYIGTVVKECGPDIFSYSLAGESSWSDYIFSVKIKGTLGVDKKIVFRYQSNGTRYDINLISGGGINLQKWINYSSSFLAWPSFNNSNNTWYNLKIEALGDKIKVFVDDQKLIDVIDTTNPLLTGKIGLQVWPGYYAACGGRTTTRFDDVLVTSLEPTPSPSPTPTPTPLQPLILLPGLGASWNHQEIFGGIDQPQSAWHKTPFMDNYNALLQTLQSAGYSLGENLFVFYYDWLQPIDQSATDLKNYIKNVVGPPPETEIDLVGHSLGGLVARTYIQNNPGSHQVDQLITLGSPHKGAPQVYKAWEGAELDELLGDKERIGAGILLRLRGFSYQNLVQAVRNLVPSLGNLLFIEDYLKWNVGGVVKPESSMSQQNTWLKGLGVSPELLGVVNTIVGAAGDTPRWLKIVERNQIDETLGRWEDGKPIGEEPAMGDSIVLEESAKLEGANIVTLPGLNHRDLIKSATGQEKILELLGISGVGIVEQPEISFEPALVLTVASPVTLRVTDPLGRQIGAGIDLSEIPNATFSAQEKIIIIPEALGGEYKVEVLSENTGGSYNLLIGQLTQTQDIWSSYKDTIGSGETDTYDIPVDNSLVTTDSYLANLINLKLESLFKEIQKQKINPKVKAGLISKVLKILGQTKPLPIFLNLGKDKLALKHVSKAIEETARTINYAEKFNPDSLPALREILDLLGELESLLSSTITP